MASKERPLLHAADLRLRRNLLRVAAVLGFGALLLFLVGIAGRAPADGVGLEIYKLLLQFLLVTAGGGVFVALVGEARDVARRRQERAAAVQVLDRELDAAYRALKKVKRRLRGHSRCAGAGGGKEYKIPREVFEKAMDDLLDAQLELETICDHVGQRDDILQPARLKRMKGPLRYASRYYHDVHEDFEKGRVRLDGGFYALGGAFNLNDYLRSSREKPDRPAAVAYQLKLLRSNLLPLSQRAQALEELIEASPIDPTACPVTEDGLRQGDKIRYADAAGACFELLSMELAQVRAKLLS